MTKRLQTCGCLSKVNAALKKKGENTRVDSVLIFAVGTGLSVSIPRLATIKAEKSRKRMRTIVPAYCPFCGKKYPERE